jgi:hypothetical protein
LTLEEFNNARLMERRKSVVLERMAEGERET